MDEFRISSLGFDDAYSDQTNDGSKKRFRHKHAEPQEDVTDQVTLSSGGDTGEEPLSYLPPSSGEEPE
jgi:hypothetical protein